MLTGAQFETRCRELGIPLTIQRRMIFEALAKRFDHPEVDEIFEAIKNKAPGLSRATVYRVLETFVRAGIVKRIYSSGSAVRFDPNLSEHHHLVCARCSIVFDFEDARLGQLPLPTQQKTGFQVQSYSVYFEGLCQRCLKTVEKLPKRSSKKKDKARYEKKKIERKNNHV